MSNGVELVLDTRSALGEGAVWCAQRGVLYWVDIVGETVYVYDPKTGENRGIKVGQPVGTVVARASGGLMLALHQGFASLDLESEEVVMIADPESELTGNRFNDGKCDPAGRFWAGTMHSGETGAATGCLYSLDTDMSVECKETSIICSNGIVWSLDSTIMYYIDTPTMEVAAYDYDVRTGAIANRRAVVTIDKSEGSPDGMTIDSEGMLWVAHWDGSQVVRWNPDSGEKMESISVPAQRVTSCAFGGSGLDQLYITTARVGLDDDALEEQPLAGGLFVSEPGVTGIEAPMFMG
ncbi:MAG: SMP-30/gluconolactonase/LRE family protein [Candidatus Latescibacteria bacterium]|jgi:sugar lactone lactonase YvrE|nr:SMP-30/gluconolactonase/LRE family protein [Candidatus Latescibacterota bacterium]